MLCGCIYGILNADARTLTENWFRMRSESSELYDEVDNKYTHFYRMGKRKENKQANNNKERKRKGKEEEEGEGETRIKP